MSKAVKSVGSAVKSVVSTPFKALSGAGEIAEGSPRFRGSTRKIDKTAFQIEESKAAKQRAQSLGKEAERRSKEAAADRQQLIESLQAQASGQAPSLAEAQLKAASDRSLAQQLAAAQSQRGGSASARERQLMRGQAAAGREVAQDAATARMQERQMAQQLLGEQVSQEQQLADNLTQGYLSQGFNITQARQQALADYEKLQTNQFLSAQGLTAASFEGAAGRQAGLIGGLLSSGGGIAAAAVSDKREKKKIKKATSKDFAMSISDENEKKKKSADELSKLDSKKSKESKEKKEADKKESNERIKGMGQEMMKSSGDELKAGESKAGVGRSIFEKHKAEISDRMEKNIKQKMDLKKDFLDKLQAYKYEYKNPEKPGAGHGEFVSVMAQDLEKAGPIGKSMVKDMEDGTKMVDYGKGFGAILAAQAHLNKRLDELEKKSKKR